MIVRVILVIAGIFALCGLGVLGASLIAGWQPVIETLNSAGLLPLVLVTTIGALYVTGVGLHLEVRELLKRDGQSLSRGLIRVNEVALLKRLISSAASARQKAMYEELLHWTYISRVLVSLAFLIMASIFFLVAWLH